MLIFNRALLKKRRARAAQNNADAFFLARVMAERLVEKLEDTTRLFPRVLVLGSTKDFLAPLLQDRFGIETILYADNSESMLKHTQGMRIVCDEEQLCFAQHSFDLVLACGTLHAVNDVPGALAQIQRCLKPDGLFLAIFLGGNTLHELRQVFTEASIATEGGAAPRVSPFIDVRDAGSLLQRAGFALPVVDTETLNVSYADTFALMRDLRNMGETNALLAQPKHFSRRSTLLRMAELYQQQYSDADGRITATFELITLTGWAPHASQQQPAKRGSGKVNLGDALK